MLPVQISKWILSLNDDNDDDSHISSHNNSLIWRAGRVSNEKLWGLLQQAFLHAVCPSCSPTNRVKAVKTGYPTWRNTQTFTLMNSFPSFVLTWLATVIDFFAPWTWSQTNVDWSATVITVAKQRLPVAKLHNIELSSVYCHPLRKWKCTKSNESINQSINQSNTFT